MSPATFWIEVKSVEGKLKETHPTGCVFVTSLANHEKNTTEGSVAEVNLQTGARLLASRTHRLSTEDEVAAHKKREDDNLRSSQEAEIRSKRTYNSADPTSVAAAVVLAMRQLSPEAPAATAGPGPVKAPLAKDKQ